MMTDAPRPPRAALWLLRRLPQRWREHVTGDLVEDFQRRCTAGSRLSAWAWFWRETMASMTSLRETEPAPLRTTPGDTPWITFFDDVRLAVRVLRRNPAFVILCVGTLIVGIGATTAIFSIVNPLILQGLPYPHPNQLMMVLERDADGPTASADPLTAVSNVGYASYVDIVDQSRSIEHATATGQWEPVIGTTDPERVSGEKVTASYFATLGVRPILGRPFTSSEDQPDHNTVIIISNGLWRRRFGADPTIVGRAVTVNGTPYTVVGVMPPAFEDVVFPGTEVWRPLGYAPTLPMACRTCRHLQMFARLRQGVTPSSALVELNAISAHMVADHPTEYSAPGMVLMPLQGAVMHAYRPVLVAIGAAGILILLISSANVANLQLTRAVRRRKEFAVRAALGAKRLTLARQLLAEALVIAAVGGAGAIAVAWLVLPVLVRQLPAGMPRIAAIHVNAATFGVAALAVLAVAMVVALVPALPDSGHTAHDELRSGAAAGDYRNRRSLKGLVVGEFALALILLVGAGLVAHSLMRLLAVDVGFDPSHLLSLQLNAVGPTYDQDSAVYAYHDELLAAVRAVPGVRSAALASQIPLAGNVDRYSVETRDHPLANPELAPSADRYVVSKNFLETMRVPVVRGRRFEPTDFSGSAPKVALVSRTLAGQLWPGEDPVGKQMRVGGPKAPWRAIVGVVGDVRHMALGHQGTGQFYVPERQWPWSDGGATLVVRTAGSPEALAHTLRQAAAAVDPTQPILARRDNGAHRGRVDRAAARGHTAVHRIRLDRFDPRRRWHLRRPRRERRRANARDRASQRAGRGAHEHPGHDHRPGRPSRGDRQRAGMRRCVHHDPLPAGIVVSDYAAGSRDDRERRGRAGNGRTVRMPHSCGQSSPHRSDFSPARQLGLRHLLSPFLQVSSLGRAAPAPLRLVIQ